MTAPAPRRPWASTRDASCYNRPDTRSVKVYHVADPSGAACCSGVLLVELHPRELERVPENLRCRRRGCVQRWPTSNADTTEEKHVPESPQQPAPAEGQNDQEKWWPVWGVLHNTPKGGHVIAEASEQDARARVVRSHLPQGCTAEVVWTQYRMAAWRNDSGEVVADPEGVPVVDLSGQH